MKKTVCLLLALMLLLSLAACAGTAEETTPTDGTSPVAAIDQPSDKTVESDAKNASVVMGLQVDPATFAPYGESNTGRTVMLLELYEDLFICSEFGGTFLPWVGESFEWTGDDGLILQVKLHDNVYDQDGNHFTASDVVFMYKIYGEMGLTSATKYFVTSDYESIEIVDKYTLNFHMAQSTVDVVYNTFNNVPVFTEAAYTASGDGFAKVPVSTSQYKLVDYVGGSYYTIEKDENWWGNALPEEERHPYTAGNVDTCTYRIITDAAQMAIALETGVIDIANYVTTSEAGSFMNSDGTAKSGYTVAALDTNPSYYLSFNAYETSVCQNELVRQAICWAVDNQELVDIVLEGNGEASVTFGGSMYAGVSQAMKEAAKDNYYGVDYDKAKELLAEAGYPDGIDITLMVNSDATMGKAAQTVQTQLARAGITVHLVTYDSALFDSYKIDPEAGWDVYLSVRGNSSGYVQAIWNNQANVAANAYGNGAFVVDEEFQKAVRYLMTQEGANDEDVLAVYNDYFVPRAYFYGLYTLKNYYVAVEGVTNLRISYPGNIMPTCCSFAADYVSVADK